MNLTNSEASPFHPEVLTMSVADSCRATSLGKTQLYQLIKEGRLKVTKVGKRTLVSVASLRALVEGAE